MRQLSMIVPRRPLVTLALLAVSLSPQPASAQDVFGFFRLFSAPVAREPVYRPYDYPDLERRTIRRLKKVVRADPPTSKIPIKPKAPWEVTNPVPELLTDRTLRRGDIVMFPEGLRVFNGHPGSEHALTDFVTVSQAGSVVPSSTRKLLASVRPDSNPAWSAEKPVSGRKLAEKTRNIDVSGNVTPKRR